MLDPDPLAGTRYRALEVLGAGAMGDVFLAENIALQSKVVVKLIKAKLAGDASAVDRMRLEAQAAAQVSHPNIIGVLDFATTDDGLPFLVMEHLIGHTLKREVRERGPLPVQEAIDLARQTLAGLAAVHELGVVHRDIKPANIFLCGGSGARVLKIIDFGIAKVMSASPNAPKPLAQPTAEGWAVGTPRFFSPEQALGYQVGPTTDLYAVGALLFWMLTARDPFHDRKEVLEILKAHLQAPPPLPSSLNAMVPPELDLIVVKALAKKPEDRYQTAGEFSEALAVRLSPERRWHSTEIIDTRAVRSSVASHPASGADSTNETEPMPTITVPSPLAAERSSVTAGHVPADELTTTPFPRLNPGGLSRRGAVLPQSWLAVLIVLVIGCALWAIIWLRRG